MFRVYRKTVCLLLAVVMTVSPTMGCRQKAAGPEAKGSEAAGKLDLSYVTPGAVFGGFAHPRRVLTAPEMQMLPIEVLSALGKKELGIDPLDVEQVMWIVQPPRGGSPPGAGAVLRFSKAYNLDDLSPSLLRRTVDAELEGKAYRRGAGPMDASIYMPDRRTLIVATDGMLRSMVANRSKPVEGPLSKLLGQRDASQDLLAVLSMEPVRELAAAQLAVAPLPPQFAGVKKLPELLSAVEVKFNLTGDLEMSLVAYARDAQAAKEIEQLVDACFAAAREQFRFQAARLAASDDPVERAMAQYMQRISQGMFEMFRPVRKGDRLELSGGGQQNAHMQMATIGILVALLLPAIQAAREAARRAQSTNNLKLIGLAMHNYHDAYRKFPARAILDEQGKPLLSWRVQILPYIEQQALYKQFKLDEPWDSQHNKKLIPLMPDIYRNPSSAAQPHKTTYLVPVGEGTMFEGTKATSLKHIRDGTSKTIMAVETNDDRAVIWTRPDDWQYDPQQPLSGLGEAHPGGFLALFADGHVQFLPKDISPDILKALLSPAGGEPVGDF